MVINHKSQKDTMNCVKYLGIIIALGIPLTVFTGCDLFSKKSEKSASSPSTVTSANEESPLGKSAGKVNISGVVAVGIPLESAEVFAYDVNGDPVETEAVLTDISGNYAFQAEGSIAFPLKLTAVKGSLELLTILPDSGQTTRHLNPLTTLVAQQVVAEKDLKDVTEEVFLNQGDTVINQVFGKGLSFGKFNTEPFVPRTTNTQTNVSMADIILDTLGEMAQGQDKTLTQLIAEKVSNDNGNTTPPFFENTDFQLSLAVNLVLTNDDSSIQSELDVLDGDIELLIQSYSKSLNSVKQNAALEGLDERRQVKGILNGIISAVQAVPSENSKLSKLGALEMMVELLGTPLIQTVQSHKDKNEEELLALTEKAGGEVGAVIYEAIKNQENSNEKLSESIDTLVKQVVTSIDQGEEGQIKEHVEKSLDVLTVTTTSVSLQLTFPVSQTSSGRTSQVPVGSFRTISKDAGIAENTKSPSFQQTEASASSLARAGSTSASISKVARVVVEVRRTDNGAQITQTDFSKNAEGRWAGTLFNLPRNIALTFIANAFDAMANKKFTGSIEASLKGISNTIAINLSSVTNQTPLIFVKLSISAPQHMLKETTKTIRVHITGQTNETLNYEIVPATGGGSFSNSVGTITLQGTESDVTFVYQAPPTPGAYTHRLKFTNSYGNITEEQFNILVVSAYTTDLSLQFSPVFNRMEAIRKGNQITWNAIVEDDGPLSELTYLWEFDGGLLFENPRSNPAVMLDYAPSVSGILKLTITDRLNAGTTITYTIKENQFAEISNTLPIAEAGKDLTVAVGSEIHLDGSQSVDIDGGTLTYNWILLSKPNTSSVVIEDYDTEKPSITPDVEGNYKLSLVVSDGIDSSADLVSIVALNNLGKPTLKIGVESDRYTLTLWSPSSFRSAGLRGVENVGVLCPGLSGLEGESNYHPIFTSSNEYHSISFTDITGGLDVAGENHNLYSFSCTSTPQLRIGDFTAIIYANASGLVGKSKITAIELN